MTFNKWYTDVNQMYIAINLKYTSWIKFKKDRKNLHFLHNEFMLFSSLLPREFITVYKMK